MLRAVILEHRRPDGSAHFDWLVEIRPGPDPDERALAALRVSTRPDLAECAGFDAERIRDHRRWYLDHEGAVPGGRGMVRRRAAGAVRRAQINPDRAEFVIDWGRGAMRYLGVRAPDGLRWRFTVEKIDAR